MLRKMRMRNRRNMNHMGNSNFMNYKNNQSNYNNQNKHNNQVGNFLIVEGTTGKEVEELQIMLQNLSNVFPSLPIVIVDGYYGNETKNTVMKFQSLNSLPTTGEVDDMTWNKIKEFLDNRVDNIPINITTDDIDLSDNVIRIGSKGRYVSDLQGYLNIAAEKYPRIPKVRVDGIFGENTQQAVLAFQRELGLNTDGVVGVQTWDALYNVSVGEAVTNIDE